MLIKICSVKDSAAQAFGRPLFVPSVGVAQRSFSDEVNRVAEDNHMNRYPSDFELYEIGEFDDSTGVLVPVSPPRLVCRAVDIRLPQA